MDLGSFISDFAEPLIGDISDVLEPLKPIIDVLNTDTKLLEALGIDPKLRVERVPCGRLSLSEGRDRTFLACRRLDANSHYSGYRTTFPNLPLVLALAARSVAGAEGGGVSSCSV